VIGVEFANDDVMTLSYPERQLVVVDSDEVVEAARQAANDVDGSEGNWDLAAGALAAIPGGAATAATVVAAGQLWKAHKRAERANLPYLIVSISSAENLRFPNGHPLGNVVYVGDPGVAGNYYPVASFHRVLFEGKVAEALRLLRSLGAAEISIEYLQGFDRGGGVDLSISMPAGAAGQIAGAVNRTTKASSGAKTTMRLSPTAAAQIPNDLIWFHSEPLWREIADARLESGLQAFTLEVNYTDDFGVNASLEAKISNVGLDLGGTFTDFRETVWRLSGTFADQ
jgi:hypothetical protein